MDQLTSNAPKTVMRNKIIVVFLELMIGLCVFAVSAKTFGSVIGKDNHKTQKSWLRASPKGLRISMGYVLYEEPI